MSPEAAAVGPEVERLPRLWVVRHGETAWSAAGRHTGRTDVPLTTRGKAQARSLGRRLATTEAGGGPFALVLTSPRTRARDTARLAGFGGRAVVDDDLAEWDYGADEGRTTPEIQRGRPGWSVWGPGPTGGETIDQVAARADRVIVRARGAAGDVLAFGHAHQLRILAARWIGLAPTAAAHLLLGPASVSILGWERETPAIERWNEPLED